MWLFLTKNSKIKSIIRDVTESPELWNKQLRDELIALCQKTRITKKTVFLLRKLIKKYPKIGGDIKMTLEQHLHSHKNLSHLEHTASEVQDRAKAGLVPTLAMWGFSALAATYVSLFGLPTGKDAQYLNLPVAEAQAEEGMRLPDLSGAKYLGEKHKDILSAIPGKETTIKGYKKNGRQIIVYSLPNGKVYGFGKETVNGREYFWDGDADGIFEQHSKQGHIDDSKYGY
jgi:hypothetical protein